MSCDNEEIASIEAQEKFDEIHDEINVIQARLDEKEEEYLALIDKGFDALDDEPMQLIEEYDDLKNEEKELLEQLDEASEVCNQADADLLWCQFNCKEHGIWD